MSFKMMHLIWIVLRMPIRACNFNPIQDLCVSAANSFHITIGTDPSEQIKLKKLMSDEWEKTLEVIMKNVLTNLTFITSFIREHNKTLTSQLFATWEDAALYWGLDGSTAQWLDHVTYKYQLGVESEILFSGSWNEDNVFIHKT